LEGEALRAFDIELKQEGKMKVAVLMSTYNGEKYIREQIDSILQQSGPFKVDLWVRDDGSTDSTHTILEEYRKKGQLNWYTGENLGPAKSFLELIRNCKDYDYYAFADQDDYWMEGKIAAGVKALEGNLLPAMYFANAELVNSNLESLGRLVYKKKPATDFETIVCSGGVLGCTIVFNHRLAELIQQKELPEKIRMHDYYLACVCTAVSGKIIYDDSAYLKYRQHESNVQGVKANKLAALKSRWAMISKREKVSVADQASTILNLYREEIDLNASRWLERVSVYRDSLAKRIAMACNLKMRCPRANIELTIRLSMLLGNR